MKHLLSLLAFLLALPLAAQEGNNTPPPSGETPQAAAEPALQVHGSLRTDALVPQYDERIGTDRVDNRVLSNSYLDLRLAFRRRYEAGLRAEYMKQPLPGFDPAFRGAGVPYFYATARFDRAEITLGSYYEQFGSGLVLRTYEEPRSASTIICAACASPPAPSRAYASKPSPAASAIIGKPTPLIYMVPMENGIFPPITADSPSARRGSCAGNSPTP